MKYDLRLFEGFQSFQMANLFMHMAVDKDNTQDKEISDEIPQII